MGSNAQVALEKFARYFEVECRLVPVSEESRFHLDPKKAMEYVDENTIGIFLILGSMFYVLSFRFSCSTSIRYIYWTLRTCEGDVGLAG
jgi:hypothetical protein